MYTKVKVGFYPASTDGSKTAVDFPWFIEISSLFYGESNDQTSITRY